MSIEFDNINGKSAQSCTMLLQLVQKNIFRVRFNPDPETYYCPKNIPSVVHSELKHLRTTLEEQEPFSVSKEDLEDRIELVTKFNEYGDKNFRQAMKVVVTYDPFKIEVFNYTNKHHFHDQEVFKVWETADSGIYYTFNGSEKEDYAIIQAIKKPATAKYIGFGEQGGKSLCKNKGQVNYFNFDNMRYPSSVTLRIKLIVTLVRLPR